MFQELGFRGFSVHGFDQDDGRENDDGVGGSSCFRCLQDNLRLHAGTV